MIRLVCTETLRELSNIGSSGLLLKDSPVCWMETIRDAQPGCRPAIWPNCAQISVVHPENWGMTRTCGTDCCCLTILLITTPYRLVSGNARGSFINSVSVSKDPIAKPVKLMVPIKRPLKKLLPVNARPYNSTVVRGRSPFSTPQQADANVGTKRATISCNLISPPVRQKVGFSERSI